MPDFLSNMNADNSSLNIRLPLTLLAFTAVALVISGINPHDRLTWVLEVFPYFIVGAEKTHRRCDQ